MQYCALGHNIKEEEGEWEKNKKKGQGWQGENRKGVRVRGMFVGKIEVARTISGREGEIREDGSGKWREGETGRAVTVC